MKVGSLKGIVQKREHSLLLIKVKHGNSSRENTEKGTEKL